MTTVLAGMTWATERGKLLRHFRYTEGDEGVIQTLFLTAVEVCHEEIGRRDFTTPAIATTTWIAGMGLTEASEDEVLAAASIPWPVRFGVWEWVRVAYHLRHELPGVAAEGNGAASRSLTQFAANNLGFRPTMIALGHWRRYQLDATLSGREPG